MQRYGREMSSIILIWSLVGFVWALKGYSFIYPQEFRSKRSDIAVWIESFICGPIVFGFWALFNLFQWFMFHDMQKHK